MYYGARTKGILWKVGCFLASLSILACVLAGKNLGATIGAAIGMIVIGFLFTLPFGIRTRKLSEGGGVTGGEVAAVGGIGAAIMGNWILLITIGIFYLFVVVMIWVGDVIYSSIWKLVSLATGRQVSPVL